MAVVLHLADGGSVNPYWRAQALSAVLYGALGAYIAARRPGQRLGWLLVVAGLGYAVTAFSSHYALPAGDPPYDRPLAAPLAWLGSWTWALALGITTNLALLLFPDGRLPSRRWWPAAAVSVTGMIVMIAVLAAAAWGVGPGNPEPDGALIARYLPVGSHLILAGSVLAALSLVARYARAPSRERRQVRPVMIAGVGVALGTALSWTMQDGWVAGEFAAPLAVGAVAFALLRHGLYDIDVVVNRTLVYAGLSGAIALTYAAAIGLLSIAGAHSEVVSPLVAGVAVALLFGPLRDRLQRAVDRLVYGDRHDPFAAIERLGQRLEGAVDPGAALDAVVEAVAHALRVPAVTLERRTSDGFRHLAGERPRDTAGFSPVVVPLVYQGERVGRMLVWPREPGRALAHADRRVVDGLAHQIAAVAHATTLAEELQRSREHLVTAREEERRRIRRDLHDGLGARLSGVVFGLQASRNLAARDPQRVARLLEELCADTQEAISDVRRLVYDLRPPALDELGLVSALRQHAAAVDGTVCCDGAPLSVRVEASNDLPSLSAAVEVAVYRVAVEALTNVVRHSHARACHIRLAGAGTVELDVTDDGLGLPPEWQAGVGVCSMRERIIELGGRLSIEPGDGGRGTRVSARVPLREVAAA